MVVTPTPRHTTPSPTSRQQGALLYPRVTPVLARAASGADAGLNPSLACDFSLW